VRIFNQYSFLVAAVFLIGLLAVLASRTRAKQAASLVLVVVVIAILVIWYFLRPTPSVLVDTAEIQAQIGICVFDRRRWGKGMGTSALRTVSEWACGALGVSAIEAGVYAENMASQKIFVAAGYEWRKDVADTYERDGRPTTVRFYRFPGPGQPSSGVPPSL